MTSDLQRQIELAEMADDDWGVMGATVLPTSRAFVPPRVELQEDYLLWWRSWPDSGQPHGHEASPRGMLDAFVRLVKADDVLQFARRYGPLALCDHGVPATHNWTAERPGCYPTDWQLGVCREPLERWFHYVREARAIVGIVAALRWEEREPEDAWQVLLARYEGDDLTLAFAQRARDSDQGRRLLICEAVNWWLALANARLSLGWKAEAKPVLNLRGTTFTILATQLMFAIAQAHRLAICDACGQPYLREGRAPQRGRLNFCSSCQGTKLANTLRQRAYRRRKRSQDQRKEDIHDAQAR